MDKGTPKEVAPSYRLREIWAEGVVCKHCGRPHWITGQGNDNVPVKNWLDERFEVWCREDGSWHEHGDEDIIEKEISAPTTTIDSKILMRIVEIENRVTKLEGKISELPEKDGIKQLKDEMKNDFTGFLADALKKGETGATYG